MKVNFNIDLNLINPIDEGHSLVDIKSPTTIIIEAGKAVAIEIPCKLELHLRNAEAVAVPIVLNSNYKVRSHDFTRPLKGTHDNLYFKLDNPTGEDICINAGDYLLSLKFISLSYWKYVTRFKSTEGILSVPVSIELN